MTDDQNFPTSHSAKKLNALTSLRFFAAAMIVLGHCHGEFGRSSRIAMIFALNQAVSFFFVLSGFILVYVYPSLDGYRERTHFLLARVARIWPAHLASLLLLLILAPMTLRPTIHDSIPWVLLANIFMVHSWIPLWNYFLSFNGVSWSISTEFFFYLCFPILISQWPQTWFKKLFLSLLLLSSIIFISNILHLPNQNWVAGLSVHALVYINPLARIFEFIIGMAVALAWSRYSPLISSGYTAGTITELSALALAVASTHFTPVLAYFQPIQGWIGEAGRYWIISSGSVICFGVLIFVMALEKGWLSKLLSWHFAVLLGEISYSIYLIHTILLRFYQYYKTAFLDIPGWVLYILYWILLIVISHLIWLFIERPSRKFIMGLWHLHANKQKRLDIHPSGTTVHLCSSTAQLFKMRLKWAVIFELLFVSTVSLMVVYRIHQPAI